MKHELYFGLVLLLAVFSSTYTSAQFQGPCDEGAPTCNGTLPTCEDGTAQPPCANNDPPMCEEGVTLLCQDGSQPNIGRPDGGDGGGVVASGQTSVGTCTPNSGTCSSAGTSNYVYRSLSYNVSTGKMTGTITTNQCVDHPAEQGTVDCIEQQFPAPDFASAPSGIPTLNRIALGLKSGINIYSAYEAGFGIGNAPFPCGMQQQGSLGGTYGECLGGLSVEQCDAHLAATCAEGDVLTSLFLDNCGGHANPYHYHADMVCDYDLTTGVHSAATGLGLDGVVIYGKYETGTSAPLDLDPCNGHLGPVPESTEYSITASTVYHYHMTTSFPHTLGCFGPVADEAACKALYPQQCGDGVTALVVKENEVNVTYDFDLYCPCASPVLSNSSTAGTPPPDPTPDSSNISESPYLFGFRLTFVVLAVPLFNQFLN
eukprot:CAMPEP_0196580674 /NCGR_PEP_ID=MMETSP1081-20130531/29978_1 /TAXON_ID=36882 /ORGANISM="Pyramimonas amylifera, Strain CCMP720" /LENGTH=428 /DNA_ID=CAMNT_0041900615 /DNA_START=106 /DNA_END=1392 /DNA_ORIENTATION=+